MDLECQFNGPYVLWSKFSRGRVTSGAEVTTEMECFMSM